MQKIDGRFLMGILIIGFGVVALLNNFGIADISIGYLFHLLWPVLIIAAGINFISTRRDLSGIVTGAVILGLGVVLLGRNAGLFEVDMTYFWKGFWPVVIILIGIHFLRKDKHYSRGNLAIMGSIDKTKETWELKSGEYTAVMGGIELDIRRAVFKEREIFLNLSAIMGGISIILPEDVAVTCNGTSILGGVDIMGKGSGGFLGNTCTEIGDLKNASKIIHLTCTCIMGGIEIKR